MNSPSPAVTRAVSGSKAVLNSRMLVNALSKELGVPKKKVRAILAGLAEATGIALKQGKSVQITGIGTLRVRSVPVAPGSKEMSDVKRIALTAARQLKATALEP